MNSRHPDLIPFNTAIEGIEVMAMVDYIPAGEDHNHDIDLRHVIHAGADIYELVSEGVKNTIRERFLTAMDETADMMKTERRLEMLE